MYFLVAYAVLKIRKQTIRFIPGKKEELIFHFTFISMIIKIRSNSDHITFKKNLIFEFNCFLLQFKVI